jgi:hypothetical protein
MVVPTLASAQEQGSTHAASQSTDEVTADDTTTEAPVTETPATEAPDTGAPVEPTEPAPVEPAAPADTSKAAAPEASSEPAPATAEAAAPEPAPAEVAAAEAKVTSSPGNDGGGGATAGRALADGGGELEATKAVADSKPGCLARGGSDNAAVHDSFPDDGSCAQSLFENGNSLPTEADGVSDLELDGPNGTVELDIWSEDDGDTVNVTLLSGGPVALDLYVKGGQPHTLCTDNSLADGETLSCSPTGGGFSHLDACVREATTEETPPPTVVDTPPEEENTPPEDDVLTQEQREQRQEQQQQVQEEATPPVVPTAVTPAPEEALPFTGLDTGWLVLLSLGLLGSGVLLRRKVS